MIGSFTGRGARRRTRRSSQFAASAACIERLELRVLLSDGDLLLSQARHANGSTLDRYYDVAVQVDGKIVAVGAGQFGDDSDFLVARYHTNGTLDTSFSGDGYRNIHFSGRDDFAHAVAIQKDGKIVVAGHSKPTSGSGTFDIAVARLNTDGTTDSSFSDDGRVLYFNSGGSVLATSVAVTPTGRIVVGGFDESVPSGLLVQFDATGRLDMSFDDNGFEFVGNAAVEDLVVDPKGNILTVSTFGEVRRFSPSGRLDLSFGNNGKTTIGFDVGTINSAHAIAIGPSGEIVIGGESRGGGGILHPGVARLLPTGAFDNSFNLNGRVSFHVSPGISEFVSDVAVLPNGSIVVVGFVDAASSDGFIAQLLPNGIPDVLFAGNGKRTFNSGIIEKFKAVAVTSTGDYVAVGEIAVPPGTVPFTLLAIFDGLPVAEDLIGFYAGAWFVGRSTQLNFITTRWVQWANVAWDALRQGDFNGDGRTDVLGFLDGTWWVGIASNGEFKTTRWSAWSNLNWQNVTVGDVNNDGRDDVLARLNGQWWVATSNGVAFRAPSRWTGWSSLNWEDVTLTDLTGDGQADLLARINGQWWASISTGTRFTAPTHWASLGNSSWTFFTFDADGDGRSDLVGFSRGQWWVGLSSGQRFTTRLWRAWSPDATWQDMRVGDFNGDGRDDVFARFNTQFWVGISTSSGFSTQLWGEGLVIAWTDVTVGDFTGDGRDDVAARIGTQWFVLRSLGARFFNDHSWGTWSTVAWKVITAGEVSRSTASPAPAPVALPSPTQSAPLAASLTKPAIAAPSDEELAARFWTFTDDDELASLLLTG